MISDKEKSEILEMFKRELELADQIDATYWQPGYPKMRNELMRKIFEVIEKYRIQPAGTPHKERLTPGLVSCLSKAIEFVHSHNKNEFHLQRDLTLTKTEYNNFQKLRYFGLCVQVEGKLGYWLITSNGGAFLRNDKPMPIFVWTQDNHIIEKSEEMCWYKDFRNKVPYFDSEFEYAHFPDPQQKLDIPTINKSKTPDLHDPKTLLRLCQ